MLVTVKADGLFAATTPAERLAAERRLQEDRAAVAALPAFGEDSS
jgi:hypothetical protein